MKFGKYLAKRSLDLPEYTEKFIDYKRLKKLIKRLSAPDPETLATAKKEEIEKSLRDNKASFFFQLERELEKVNDFYIEKENELKTRLKILNQNKDKAYEDGRVDSKSSVDYISLHEGYSRFKRDLDRLAQFIDLNATGFSKVLKKWDKRSKSRTKELYLSRQVKAQPVFHREELSTLNDQAGASLLELEAWSDGDAVIFEKKDGRDSSGGIKKNTGRGRDDLYHEFIRMVQTANGDDEVKDAVEQWIEQTKYIKDAQDRITKIFLSTITTNAPDISLKTLYESGFVNLAVEDGISEKNCLHRAATTGRKYVFEVAENVKINKKNFKGEEMQVDAIDTVDASGKTPLHYAALNGNQEIIQILVNHGVSLDDHDKDNYSALLYAIVNKFETCVKQLIDAGANIQADSNKDYVPLNLACQYGLYNIVEMLLDKKPNICTDAEGLYPLHIVAREGHSNLVPLLIPYVDINQLDKFNGWPALSYAASEGHPDSVKALIEANANVLQLDEDGYSALYYAGWEGNVKCMGEIASKIPKSNNQMPIDNSIHLSGMQEMDTRNDNNNNNNSTTDTNDNKDRKMSMDLSANMDEMDISELDQIPDLELPPPIIPLRRYGHNFLDNKIVLQILFDPKESPIRLHDSSSSSSSTTPSPAGRLTISTRNKDNLIPRSIILPMGDNDKSMSFQVESIDDFALDFEIFPTFGTQVIAKGAALPYVFNNRKDTYTAEHFCQLPLFDMRLKAVGELAFRFQVVKPYSGKPLEIAKYDTYWKSTSQVENNSSNIQSLSFITASSLSGEYGRIFVCLTKDNIPVVSQQKWLVELGISGVEVPIGDLTLQQVLEISGGKCDLESVENAHDVNRVTDKGKIIVTLEEFLRRVPLQVKIDIGIMYPTDTDANYSNLGLASFSELNQYVDRILDVIFSHAREIRKSSAHFSSSNNNNNSTATRSIIFSSKHPDVCSMLNWKQPNYPVFFHMNGLKLDHTANQAAPFAYQSAHAFPVEDLDRRCTSIKEAASFAASNNLLGVICSARLLGMVPTIVDAVRAMGLVLVANVDVEGSDYIAPEGCDGSRNRSVLMFEEQIEM